MRRLLILFPSFLLFLTANQAVAADPLYVGGGTAACSQVLADYAKDSRVSIVYLTWSQGYMSGVNRALAQFKAGPRSLARAAGGDDRMQAFLDYCKQHPDDHFIEAVDSFFGTLPVAQP